MKYQQSIIDLTMSYSNNKIYSKLDCLSGEQYNDNGKIAINTYNNNFNIYPVIEKLNNLEMKELKNVLESIQCEMFRNEIYFSAYFKIHNEKIKINDVIEDQRYYGYLRLVFKDKYQDNYIDEIPFIKYNLAQMESGIYSSVERNKNIIKGKNKYIGFKRWNSIPVILSPQAAGYFIHEVLGHLLEEDVYQYGQIILTNLSCSNKLTVIDNIEGYEEVVGLSKFDDNGVSIKPVTLMQDGKIKNLIKMKKESSNDILYGMARRENFEKEALPRMRNTFIKPYDNMNQKDIISKYKEAIFVDKIYHGNCIYSTGEYFIFGNGFYLKNGEKQCTVNNLKIQSKITFHLQNIGYIGKDFKIITSECSKLGNSVRVCMGGPTISFNNAEVEGELYR